MPRTDHRTLPMATAAALALCLLLQMAVIATIWPVSARADTVLPANEPEAWRLCAREIDRIERAQRIPPLLLGAIAQVESGRWNEEEQAIFSWPWTVMAEGRGRYLPTKAAAIAEVRLLRGRGITNIDVGCMQVNLHHHPDAFDNLEDAFDPARNVSYAADFLKRLRAEKRSWAKAVAHYHSATPTLHRAYRAKVYEVWRSERRRASRLRQEARHAPVSPQAVSDPARPGGIAFGFLF